MKSLCVTYAYSLFSLAEDEGLTEKIYEEIKSVFDIFSENKDYINLLDSPTLPKEKRFELIDEAFESYMEYVRNFLKILCEKKRVFLFFGCVKEYEKLYNENFGIMSVTAITAVPLSEALREKLMKKLEEQWKKKIVLTEKVDRTILGGIILRTDGLQTDASVRTKLEKLRAQIVSDDFR